MLKMDKLSIVFLSVAFAVFVAIIGLAIHCDTKSKQMLLRESGISAGYFEAAGTSKELINGINYRRK
jgi:hypothetical protein